MNKIQILWRWLKKTNHKYINNRSCSYRLKSKKCSRCKRDLPLNSDYFHKNKISKDGYLASCKECVRKYTKGYYIKQKDRIIQNVNKYRENNIDEYKRVQKQYRSSEIGKKRMKKYNKYRQQYKTHTISKEQWVMCKLYFSSSCAYCGMTEEEHRRVYNQDLHKEHVDSNGSNDLSNCVPSCKVCNSRKRTSDFNIWYSYGNPIFDENRLTLILEWLSKFSDNAI